MLKPFWEETYRNPGTDTFGEPSAEIIRLSQTLVCHGVLHLIERDEWQQLIPRIKQSTNPGGVNVIAVFTDEIPPSEDMAPFTKGLFREGELAEKWWPGRNRPEYVEVFL